MAVLKDCHQRLPKWWLSWKTVIKDYRSDGCLSRLSSKTREKIAEVMSVLKDCHQRLPKWWLSWKTVIKDYRSDGCLSRLSSKTREKIAEVMSVLKDCHQSRSDHCLERLSSKTTEVMAVCKDCHRRLEKRLLKWCLSWKIVIKDCRSDHCLERLSSKTTEVMAVCKDCHQRLEKRLLKWCLSSKTGEKSAKVVFLWISLLNSLFPIKISIKIYLFLQGAGSAPLDLTTLSSLRAHRTLKTVVKRKFVICLGDPLVTSCVSDAQNCGKMQIFNFAERPLTQKVIVGRPKLW